MSQIVEQQAIQTLPETSPEPMLPKKDPAHYTKKRHIKRWVILGGVVIVAGLVVLKVMTRPPQLPMMAGTQLTRQTLSSTVNLINSKLDDLSQEVENFFSKKLHFICLSEDEWVKEKQIYVTHLKNKEPYAIISEESIENLKPKAQSDLEFVATNVFSRDKIELI